MANIVDSVVKVEGPSELVDKFVEALPSLIAEDKETVYCEQGEIETIRVGEGTKTVRFSFETKWHTPYDMMIAAMRKYHHLGAEFHMQWCDDDGGLWPDPLFGGELIVVPKCFGEFYTKELTESWFSENQGKLSF